MRGPRLENWLTRPAYVALAAFAGGAAIAGVVFAVILLRDGGGGDQSSRPQATQSATGGPQTGVVTGTPPAATPTASRFTNPNDAVASFVQQQLGQTYVGSCAGAGQTPGICSHELYRSDVLATYFLGPPQSEALGEAVLTAGADGAWSVDFVKAASPGSSLTVGAEAVVYGAGDCLNFRPQAGTSGQPASCQLDGTRARVTEGPTQADGKTWWKLTGLGWATGEFLRPAQ